MADGQPAMVAAVTDGDDARLSVMAEQARGWSDALARWEERMAGVLSDIAAVKKWMAQSDRRQAHTDKTISEIQSSLERIEEKAERRVAYMEAVEDEAEAAAEEAHRVARVQADGQAATDASIATLRVEMGDLKGSLDTLSHQLADGLRVRMTPGMWIGLFALFGGLVTAGVTAAGLILRAVLEAQ